MRASLLVAVAGLAMAPVVAGCATAAPHLLVAQAVPAGDAPATSAATPASSSAAYAPTPEPSGQAVHGKEESSDAHATRQGNRVLGWVAVSIGAEAAVVAVITSFMMLHQNSIRSADCSNKICSADGASANTTMHNLEWWNAGAWVVAAGGVGVGTFLLLTNPSDKSLHAEVGVAPTGSGSGLLLRGAF